MGFLSSLLGVDAPTSVIDENGRYDLKRFSRQEYSTIKNILATVERKYPAALRSMGLVNESYPIVYKPRYILFDIVVYK